jgi:transposase
MWTDTTRAHHTRNGLAWPSDLTDEEWAVLEPFLPLPSFVGRPRKWPMRRIVGKRSDRAKGFVVLPRRWVVERTFAWLNRNRRLAKDFERSIASATTWLFLASVQMLARRIAKL